MPTAEFCKKIMNGQMTKKRVPTKEELAASDRMNRAHAARDARLYGDE